VVDRQHRLVLTCAHVVGKASEALVYFPQYRDGEAIVEADYYLSHVPALVGRVIAKDDLRDLTLIQLDRIPSDLAELQLAVRSPEPGETVYSIGNSALADGGMLWRYTRGDVRLVYSERIQTSHGTFHVRIVETQSPVNRGDSGGPVVNDRCEMVGVADAYSANERLVSENTDVLEVKEFLKAAQGKLQSVAQGRRVDLAPRPKGESPTVVGAWTLTAAVGEVARVAGHVHFAGDETFSISLAGRGTQHEIKRGRYAYANGVLLLIDGDAGLIAPLTWVNQNQFTFKRGKTLYTVQR
jgi:S1-C subfamily serine protease